MLADSGPLVHLEASAKCHCADKKQHWSLDKKQLQAAACTYLFILNFVMKNFIAENVSDTCERKSKLRQTHLLPHKYIHQIFICRHIDTLIVTTQLTTLIACCHTDTDFFVCCPTDP